MTANLVDDSTRPDDMNADDEGALSLLRRGMGVTPELQKGIRLTIGMALVGAAGKLAIPVLIQQIVDRVSEQTR